MRLLESSSSLAVPPPGQSIRRVRASGLQTSAGEPASAQPPPTATLADDLRLLRIRSAFYREAEPAWQVEEHDHDIYQWYVCVHGELRVRVSGETHDIGPERSILVPPKARRELLGLRRAPGYLVLIFEPLGLDLVTITGEVLALPGSLRDDLHALIDELRHPEEDHALLVRSLVLRLLIGHKRAVAIQAAPLSPLNARSHEAVIEAAERFMRTNLHQPLRRAEIAAAVHLSEPHLARLFRSATGRSVLQRLTELRIDDAKARLLESSDTISRIASEIGIVSFSHFARIFKQQVGVTPGDYRRTGGTVSG